MGRGLRVWRLSASPMFARFLTISASVFSFAVASVHAADRVVIQFEKKGQLLNPVVVALFEGDAPRHAANFKALVKRDFYRGIAVHRVLPESLVQLGDPLSRNKDKVDLGTGGPGYTLAPEIRRTHVRGVLGMGRLPDSLNPARLSNGSQFYVVLKALPELDGTQTVFGEVIDGLSVFDEIGASATDTNDSPVQPFIVRRAVVVPEGLLARELEAMRAAQKQPQGSWWTRVKRTLHLAP